MLRNKPVPNPMVVSREEFDDWAILFDPETGKAFGVDPVGTEIWNKLDGKCDLKKSCGIFRSILIMYIQKQRLMLGLLSKIW
jgi:hypothetical protein